LLTATIQLLYYSNWGTVAEKLVSQWLSNCRFLILILFYIHQFAFCITVQYILYGYTNFKNTKHWKKCVYPVGQKCQMTTMETKIWNTNNYLFYINCFTWQHTFQLLDFLLKKFHSGFLQHSICKFGSEWSGSCIFHMKIMISDLNKRSSQPIEALPLLG
jgi:hypothetical protein